MMTSRDYVRLAEALASERPHPFTGTTDPTWADVVNDTRRAMWENVCGAIAGALADDNPRFDLSRFMEACDG
jgi:hypothetical protein